MIGAIERVAAYVAARQVSAKDDQIDYWIDEESRGMEIHPLNHSDLVEVLKLAKQAAAVPLVSADLFEAMTFKAENEAMSFLIRNPPPLNYRMTIHKLATAVHILVWSDREDTPILVGLLADPEKLI